MQELRLNEETNEAEPTKGFWRRQFQKDSTVSQKKFDWIFGVILPIVCFVFDPIVFKGGEMGGAAELGAIKPFAYILSFVLVMAMSARLIWGEKLKWLNAFLAGLFIVGAAISLGIGVILLPLSLLGLVMLIGILGFTPLLTSLVYFRAAIRAYQSAKPFLEKRVLRNTFVLSAIFSVVIPYVVNVEIKKTMDEMINGDAPTIRADAQKLKYVAPLVNFHALAAKLSYNSREKHDEKTIALREAYLKLTGKDID